MNPTNQLTNNIQETSTCASMPTYTYDLHVSFIEAKPAQPNLVARQMSDTSVAIPLCNIPTAFQRAMTLSNLARRKWESHESDYKLACALIEPHIRSRFVRDLTEASLASA